ncbi:agmatine deiminase family protein [Paraburkholderia sp. Se-20369]|nr:agmatine deiminase family protein [Paraburkholderia sp. Se-20369]
MSRFDARQSGYRMPAEWEPMAATWLGWPVLRDREALWGEHYAQVCREFALVAQTIARYQRCIVVAHADCADTARERVGGSVEVLAVAAEDNWVRDCGPIFLQGARGELAAAVFRFNSWGEKYQPYDGCQQLGQDIARAAGARIFNSHMVLEGGAFYVDGQGTLVTTESCLLHPNRNPQLSRAEIEAELRRMLGVEKIIWLPGNPDEVETNGHVDGIASFIAPGKMLCQTASPEQGDYFRVMRENRRALELATDAAGRRFALLDLPSPIVTERYGSACYCDCYANYILVNGGLISTAFGVEQDAAARAVFERAFPDRRVELLPITALSMGGGSIHCSTQQQPAVMPARA